MRFYPLIPWLLIIFSAGVVFSSFVLVWKYALELAPYRKNILLALRCSAATVLVLMLFSPGIVVRELNRKRANVVFLIDGSESMSAADMPGGSTRFDSAKKTLAKLMKHHYSGCGKYVYLFNHKTVPAENADYLDMTSPFGGTDLKTAFSVIDRDIGLSRIAAVAVISDGLDHSGFPGGTGIPVYAVRTGTTLDGVPDLRIASFRPPQAMRPGEELDLNIPIDLSGFSGLQKIEIKTEIDGKVVSSDQMEIVPGKRKEYPFKCRFDEPGLHRVVFSLSKLKKEVSLLNNKRELLIEVKDEPVQPLLFFPVLNSAFRPLQRLFTDAGRRFVAVYRLRDSYSVIGTMRENPFANGFPRKASDLKRHDVIVLGSGTDSVLTDREIGTLEQYVSNGGTLVVLGGDGSYGTFRDRRFTAMMPVRSANSKFVSGNFIVDHPEIKGSVSAINLTDRVRNGAAVLLYVRGPNGARLPLAVSMSYGRGRVTALLTNSFRAGDDSAERGKFFRRFWEQLLVQTGSESRDKLRAVVSAGYIPSGGRVTISAVCENADHADFSVLSGRKVLRQPVRMQKNGPGHFTSSLSGLPDGQFVLQVSAVSSSAGVLRRYLPLAVGESTGENDDLRVSDSAFLKFCPAGRISLPGETDRLAEEINESIRKHDVLREWFPVLESAWFPALFFLLLCAEWFLRRKFNMT